MDVATKFNSLKFVRILRQDNNIKLLFCLCKCDDQDAIVIFERQSFSLEDVEGIVTCSENQFSNLISNDIYHRFQICTDSMFSKISTTLIIPATEAHIQKYSKALSFVMVKETPEDYTEAVLPFLKTTEFKLSWVYNLLSDDCEKVVYRDRDPIIGFVMVPDMKWNEKDVKELYTLAICNPTDIMTMRDLRGEHIPLLCNILNRGKEAIEQTYGVLGSSLRIYVHYHPTFNHFHVHFVGLESAVVGNYVGKAHLLDDIIDNLNQDSDFYCKKTISYVVPSESKMLEAISKNRDIKFINSVD